jgi:hypothetical protein
MERRDFFKLLLTTSLFTPLILGSKKPGSPYDLYLISDRPQDLLPLILDELRRWGMPAHHHVSFLSSHPDQKALAASLRSSAPSVSKNSQAFSLFISHLSLQPRALASFTLLQDGRIWDVRSSRLSAAWDSMRFSKDLASTLTVASLCLSPQPFCWNKKALVYREGKRIDMLNLERDTTRTFAVKNGSILVRIQEGMALVENAPCHHKICCSSPQISLPGERILCAPSRFFIEISGARPVDTVIG